MREIKLIIAALAIALGVFATFAFTTTDQKDQSSNSTSSTYHWYTPDGQTSLGVGENPSTGCTAVGDDCAIGFLNPSADPTIDEPDDTRGQD